MKKSKINRTDESVFTLVSLYVLINQAFHSLYGKENILNSDFDEDHHSFQDMVDDSIHEALVYQILLKACAYLDEWNTIFGVRTEPEGKFKIEMVKKIVKPAYKCISAWKNLRDFRNQAIAHNHRDREGHNIYLKPRIYHSPQSNGEIFLLVFCLEKITDVVTYYFEEKAMKALKETRKKPKLGNQKFLSKKQIKAKVSEIEDHIARVIVGDKLLNAAARAIPQKESPITITLL